MNAAALFRRYTMKDINKRLQAAYLQGMSRGYELGLQEARSEGSLRAAYEDGIASVWCWLRERLAGRRQYEEHLN